MTVRETIGLLLLVSGIAMAPLGWIVSHKLLIVSAALISVGAALFYTARMVKRDEALEREASSSGSYSPAVPTDIHNYTGWRTGGRTDPLDSHSGTSHSDNGGGGGD